MLDLSRDQSVTVKIVQLLRLPDVAGGSSQCSDSGKEELIEWSCCDDQTEDSTLAAVRSSKALDNVYLGETFSCYCLVNNNSEESISEISLSVDLQTNQRRCKIPLSCPDSLMSLNPNTTIRALFTHEVTEIGQHLLVCTLAYSKPSGGRLTTRKLYKFSVLKPLDVHTKFYDSTDELFLEAQVQNAADDDLIMEHIELLPADGYYLVSLHSSAAAAAGPEIIKPKCVYQFLYGLQFRWDSSVAKVNRGLAVVGKLSMVWHTSSGRHGRLQTSPLERMIAGCGDLKMKIVQTPNAVKIQQPFHVVCRITNCCDRTLEPLLILEEQLDSGLVWNSKSNEHFGQLMPASSIDLTLALIPISAGLKYVSGMHFKDTLTKRTYEPDEMAQVFVYT